MIIEKGTRVTPVDGLEVASGGTRFVPCSDKASFAVYERGGLACGVCLDVGGSYRDLRFSPSWRLPHGAHDRRAWNRFVFEAEDDRMMEMRMDPRDGELFYVYADTPLEDLDDIERSIERGLDFVFSSYEETRAFVRRQMDVEGR